MLRLIAFVLPLGLDSFAVAAALGAAGRLSGRTRLRILTLFVTFEAGMPLIGLAVGAPLARVVGGVADYVGAGVVTAIGIWLLTHAGPDEQEPAQRLAIVHGLAVLGLGMSISVDEFVIGFSLGMTRLPLMPAVIAIAAQALLATGLGLCLGARIGDGRRAAAERLAGLALFALGVFLIVERLLQR